MKGYFGVQTQGNFCQARYFVSMLGPRLLFNDFLSASRCKHLLWERVEQTNFSQKFEFGQLQFFFLIFVLSFGSICSDRWLPGERLRIGWFYMATLRQPHIQATSPSHGNHSKRFLAWALRLQTPDLIVRLARHLILGRHRHLGSLPDIEHSEEHKQNVLQTGTNWPIRALINRK